MSERCQSLFEIRRCLAVRRAVAGPGPGLPTVGHGLVPHCTPEGMQGQVLDLLGQEFRVALFERFDNAGVQQTAVFLEETAISYLVRQGVLEGIQALWEQAGLVEKFCDL
jgi:hypothetical protein